MFDSSSVVIKFNTLTSFLDFIIQDFIIYDSNDKIVPTPADLNVILNDNFSILWNTKEHIFSNFEGEIIQFNEETLYRVLDKTYYINTVPTNNFYKQPGIGYNFDLGTFSLIITSTPDQCFEFSFQNLLNFMSDFNIHSCNENFNNPCQLALVNHF